ncbi:hypothetical protein [Bdellovibrio sp. HCB337]|uniref:hypothetical protein n=1 Tax=Bdellovibrio sp. HCB337 TaxID=3394358 RepID=UPI0039A5955D
MKSMLIAFVATMSLSTTVFAGGDLLSDESYIKENTSCFQLVTEFARNVIPGAKNAEVVVPLSHVSITPGTYNQSFISVINVNDDYYTVTSSGEYSCDGLSLVGIQKIENN